MGFEVSGYRLSMGSTLDRAQLVRTIQRTYTELFCDRDFSHLALTVEHHLSKDTPLWWVEPETDPQPVIAKQTQPIGCLWMGNAVDQVSGKLYAHIFLLYVHPHHRRQGIGQGLVQVAIDWAQTRGDHQIGLQVFEFNQPAIALYTQLGFHTTTLSMVKSLSEGG